MRRKHRDLQVWQEAVQFVETVYRETAGFPANERFGLTNQMRRAALSIPANIAEGAARTGTRELLYSLSVASGSLSGLDTFCEIAVRLRFIDDGSHLQSQIEAISHLLTALIASLRRKVAPTKKQADTLSPPVATPNSPTLSRGERA